MTHSYRSKHWPIAWPAALFVAFFAIAASNGAWAAKPVCPGPHPSCDDDGSGQFPVTVPDNLAQYGGWITESRYGTGNSTEDNPRDLPADPPRYCTGEITNENEGNAFYECDAGGLVTFNLSGWQNVAKNGNQGYCDLLDPNHEDSKPEYRQFTPHRLWFRNTEVCDFSLGECEVFVSAWSYRGPELGDRHQYANLPNGLDDIGLISFGGRATIPTAVGPSGTGDGNPFADAQEWDLHTVNIFFKLAGKNKTAATCQVSWDAGTLSEGDALFFTAPVE